MDWFLTTRHWRDIHRSTPVVITPPAYEPMSRLEAKQHCRIESSVTDHDPWLDRAIATARGKVEYDTGEQLVRATLEFAFDAFPRERFIPLPTPPLVSVTSVTSIVDDGTETAMSSDEYHVDTYSVPGRVILKPSETWPTGLRDLMAGRIRYVAGYTGATKTVSSVTRSSSTATVTTAAAHGFSTGDRAVIAGADQAEYNGTFEITVTGATTFTFAVTGSPASPATGAITAASMGIPSKYRLAMAMLICHWDVNREAVLTGTISKEIELAYDALLGRIPALG